MNERIKELWEEAAKTTQGDSWEEQTKFMERYTKLIVRECAEQSMSIGRYNTPSGITPDLSIAIAVGLKKHFGVEE